MSPMVSVNNTYKILLLILLLPLLISSFVRKDKINILLVGDSVLYYNGFDELFSRVCISSDRDVNIKTCFEGGRALWFFAKYRRSYLDSLFSTYKFDYIVLKGNSAFGPHSFDKEFNEPLKYFDSLAGRCNSKIFLIQPSIKKSYFPCRQCTATSDGKDWDCMVYDNMQEMESKLDSDYSKAKNIYNLKVIPRGALEKYVEKKYQNVSIYSDKLYHPSVFGSCMLSTIIFESLFNTIPSADVYNTVLDSTHLHVLQDISTYFLAEKEFKNEN